MKKTWILFLLLCSTSVFSQVLPTSKQEFCARFEDASILTNYANESLNLMSFKNNGGLFNGGVCWWHSRFQRNVFYLSIFKPELSKPRPSEIRSLLKEIRNGERIVTIPGFSNFFDFTESYKKEIQQELNDWQLYDGIVLGSWIDGLKGDTKVEPKTLKFMMDELYGYVSVQKRIAYQKLQIKGITSHAWLIVGIKKGENKGYEIGLIDSNNPRMTENYTYKNGDDSFYEKSYGNFVPYLEFRREELRLSSVAKTYCGVKNLEDVNPENWANDYQLDLEEAKNHGRL